MKVYFQMPAGIRNNALDTFEWLIKKGLLSKDDVSRLVEFLLTVDNILLTHKVTEYVTAKEARALSLRSSSSQTQPPTNTLSPATTAVAMSIKLVAVGDSTSGNRELLVRCAKGSL